ncbi:MAG TPA: MG2 domain-containing protein [Candidatus Polarisedimenticolaceae bacterium]|nr:MG2 domain-containing protein [Candidatus Polarisedimenticolaceae bacterium]
MRVIAYTSIPLILLAAAALVGSSPHGAGAGEEARATTTVEPGLTRAEALFAEGSYESALEIYRAIDLDALGDEERRWVRMRLADAAWRSAAATDGADEQRLEQARQALEAEIRDRTREDEQDRVWAEVQESLGDYWWTRRGWPNWGQAWQHYDAALGWWAGSSEIELARERYLSIVWRAARPPHVPPHYYYGYYGNQLPQSVLENARKIAVDPRDRAHAAYLIAMGLRFHGGDPASVRRTARAFDEAVEAGRGTDWYDDALFHHAEWLAGSGRVVHDERGEVTALPDFVRAVEQYRRLLREFRKGETRYYDQAEARVEQITAPEVGVVVSNVFLPDAEVRYELGYRNVERVELALYPVELTRDLRFDTNDGSDTWLDGLAAVKGRPWHRWSHDTGDAGEHVPGRAALMLEREPAPGAYLLEASAGGETARDLVLVSRVAIVQKVSAGRALVYVCDAIDGSPRGAAEVTLWVRREQSWERLAGRTDEQGLSAFELPAAGDRSETFAAAHAGDDQAFSAGHAWHHRSESVPWRIYAFTDRPAYRPEDRVRFKVVARQVVDGGYRTPDGRTLHYEIVDPRGTELARGTLELNAFGTAWAELAMVRTATLGEYRIDFREQEESGSIGSAALFRLEEYKLPEFEVSVETPTADGRRLAFRVGDTVEADVAARYYFGGPVAGAEVEAVIYQKPLWVWWEPPREFQWLYEDDARSRRQHWGGPGQIVERVRLTTDASGRATLRFDTPAAGGQDFEYTIEARVRDASRREVEGRGTVRVSRQRYFAFVRAEHNLYRPGDEVRVELKTIDPNGEPIGADGRVRVTREVWREIWSDPAGREVSGHELPPAERRGRGWTLTSSGYRPVEIVDTAVRTGEDGSAEFRFEADEAGYYRVAFRGDDLADYPVRGETTVWVADSRTRTVGYHHGGVEILVDRDTLRAGQSAPVMISAPVEGAWVLFSIEGEELYDYRIVHLDGSVKLIEVEIEPRYVPNVFFEVALVHDGELWLDSRRVVIPPVEQFLDVAVEADRTEYGPGDTGRLLLTTRDHEGQPVSAEVALALVDASVFYIEQDLAGDPRRFFFGDSRAKLVVTGSTFQQKPYVRRDGGHDDRSVDLGDELSRRYDVEGLSAREAAETDALEVVATPAPSPAVGAKMRQEAEGAEISTVEVRTDFRATAVWQPEVVTDGNGAATVEVVFPDTLTAWRATARVTGRDDRFGIAEAEMRTDKPLIVRLQAPRFFVAGDETTVSAVVNNRTDDDLEVTTSLDVTGAVRDGAADRVLRVTAGAEARVDWRLRAEQAGQLELTARATAGELADGMRNRYPIHEHGIDKRVYRAGKLRGEAVEIKLDLPAERRSTTMSVQVTPSLAITMLDALPYLIDYPYGCTEQTMSRFLPTVIVADTLAELGLDRTQIARRLFGGIEPQHAARTHTGNERALERLDEMVRAGLDRLYDFQHDDGGWGWWKVGDSDPYMSAYVVWGLSLANDAGVRVRSDVLERGVAFLDRELVEAEERPDLQAWMLHALAVATERGGPGPFQRAALDNLWVRRDGLNAYTRALFALAAHELGQTERAETLVRNLANGVERDRSPDTSIVSRGAPHGSDAVIGTAHWGSDRFYWRWSEGAIEATAFALRALLAIDPENELVEPATEWLIRNRRGAQWSNTRDTAFVVLALTDYLTASGELSREAEYELFVNDRSIATRRVGPRDLFDAPSRFVVDPTAIEDGENRIRIVRRSGDAALYFAAEATFFSLEEPVTPAGNQVFLRRQYHRLAARPTLLEGYATRLVPLDDFGEVASGERVEVVLTIEVKNDYEYLVIEDLKPAGLEAVQLRSGEPIHARELAPSAAARPERSREPTDYTGRSRPMHQELRDRRVAFFIDDLPQGVWEVRYTLRAELPGRFHALPATIHAMYVPEIRANGAELRLGVTD